MSETQGSAEPTEVEWAVLWDGPDGGVVVYEDRARAVYVAHLYEEASVVHRTVTRGPWVADGD